MNTTTAKVINKIASYDDVKSNLENAIIEYSNTSNSVVRAILTNEEFPNCGDITENNVNVIVEGEEMKASFVSLDANKEPLVTLENNSVLYLDELDTEDIIAVTEAIIGNFKGNL